METTTHPNTTVRTNHAPRNIVDAHELTADERAEFDYINWQAVETGETSPEFFRYKGQLYDLGEFSTTANLPRFEPIAQWDGYHSDSFFSRCRCALCRRFRARHRRNVLRMTHSSTAPKERTMRTINNIQEFEAIRAEAASMTTSCPICLRSDVKVHEQIKQATRQSPAILLCFQGFCVDCQMPVPADVVQMVLA